MTGHQIGKYTIFISEDVLALLSKYRQTNFRKKEAGGILLGQVRDKSIYILRISVPSVHDKASRTTFDRNKFKSQVIIEYEFYASGKKTIYLGEWHTHPEKYPKPSLTDIRMINDQFEKNVLNEPFLILLIQGTQGIFLGVKTSSGMRTKNF